jgi:hypothetical protein
MTGQGGAVTGQGGSVTKMVGLVMTRFLQTVPN